jgi:hypothetical protein
MYETRWPPAAIFKYLLPLHQPADGTADETADQKPAEHQWAGFYGGIGNYPPWKLSW